jgi:hypothetical protein
MKRYNSYVYVSCWEMYAEVNGNWIISPSGMDPRVALNRRFGGTYGLTYDAHQTVLDIRRLPRMIPTSLASSSLTRNCLISTNCFLTKWIHRVTVSKSYLHTTHVRWVLCRHSMARSRIADGGHDLQIWRVAANILNKQSRTADKGWSSSLRVGRGANNSSS